MEYNNNLILDEPIAPVGKLVETNDFESIIIFILVMIFSGVLAYLKCL